MEHLGKRHKNTTQVYGNYLDFNGDLGETSKSAKQIQINNFQRRLET